MIMLWQTLMEDQTMARCVAAFLAWHFVGVRLWNYMLTVPVVGHWLSVVGQCMPVIGHWLTRIFH